MSRPPSIRSSDKAKPQAGFFAARWAGQTPLATLFWRDMVLVGSAVNAAALISAFVALENGAPTAVVLAVYLSPLPYNLFLFGSIWRTAAAEPWRSAARFAALGWLALAILL